MFLTSLEVFIPEPLIVRHLKCIVAYCYRSTFPTDALEKGVGIDEVADLLGYKSAHMLMRHYSKLSRRVLHVREMAAKATTACGSRGGCARSERPAGPPRPESR
jgi:integrase